MASCLSGSASCRVIVLHAGASLRLHRVFAFHIRFSCSPSLLSFFDCSSLPYSIHLIHSIGHSLAHLLFYLSILQLIYCCGSHSYFSSATASAGMTADGEERKPIISNASAGPSSHRALRPLSPRVPPGHPQHPHQAHPHAQHPHPQSQSAPPSHAGRPVHPNPNSHHHPNHLPLTHPPPTAPTHLPHPDAPHLLLDLSPTNYAAPHESRRRNAEQRAATLRADVLIREVEPNRVFCSLCTKWVQLRQDSSYCAYPWLQHRGKCLAR